jgi:hypothetical protein
MSEKQVVPVSARAYFEAVFRQIGAGQPATLNGLSHPLRVVDLMKNTSAVSPASSSGRIDTRA